MATVRGRVQPNRLSWFILGLAPMVAFAAEVDEGVGLRSIMTFSVGLGPMLIFFASFANKASYWKLNRFDIACAALSVMAFVLWRITGSGDTAVALSIASDGLAVLPIVVKSWRFPHSEAIGPFIGGLFNSSIALLVLDTWRFVDYAFPVYIFTAGIVLTTTILCADA